MLFIIFGIFSGIIFLKYCSMHSHFVYVNKHFIDIFKKWENVTCIREKAGNMICLWELMTGCNTEKLQSSFEEILNGVPILCMLLCLIMSHRFQYFCSFFFIHFSHCSLDFTILLIDIQVCRLFKNQLFQIYCWHQLIDFPFKSL